MKWSRNNRACVTLWSVLMGLDQIGVRKTFATTGDVKIKSLPFFGQDAGGHTAEARAHAFALQLDKVFRFIRLAKFEPGVTSKISVSAMKKILEDGEKEVRELADVADNSYFFFMEQPNT